MHTISQKLFFSTMEDSKNINKGEELKMYYKTCNLDLIQILSTHSLTRLELAGMPSQ